MPEDAELLAARRPSGRLPNRVVRETNTPASKSLAFLVIWSRVHAVVSLRHPSIRDDFACKNARFGRAWSCENRPPEPMARPTLIPCSFLLEQDECRFRS